MANYKSSYTGQEIDAGIAKANTALQEEQYTGTYSKPSGGIPESDLSESVQDKLNSGGGGAALSEEFKTALLDCFENVAWINDDGQEYYDALYDTLYGSKTLESINAVFTQGSNVIYNDSSLESLKQYLVVTALYNDSSTQVVTNYTLSGTLTDGTSTITVTYETFTDTFDVTVTAWDFEWYATSGVLPDGMTHEGVEWGTNNEYANIIRPNYQLAYSDLEAEIECAWIDIVSTGNAADTQINFSKTQGKAVKLFLSNTNATDVIFSGYNNGVSAPYTLNVNRSDFHKYHVIFKDGVGSLYVDGNFVVSRESYYSDYNFYPLIFSRNYSANANKLAIKSIKWRAL